MSEEENLDILTYRPIQEWTGHIVNFGMPTHDGNKSLTEIVTSSNSALEATARAMELATFSDNLAPAREPAKLEIVRMFFGGDVGGNIAQIDLDVYEEALVSHFIESFFSVASSEVIGPNIYLINWYGLQSIAFVDFAALPVTKDVRNPLGIYANYGTRAVTGDWDLDGEPWLALYWDDISTQHCSNPTYTNQTDCENNIAWGYCRGNHTSEWNNPGAPPQTKSKNLTSGNLVEANIDLYNNNTYCEGVGQCYYSSYNTNDQPWIAYTSNDEDWCMNYAANNNSWANLYWMWKAPTNTWTPIYSDWFPEPETVDAHQRYHQMTSDNPRHYPDRKSQTPTSQTAVQYYYTDTWGSFGNGMTDGRSLSPIWLTNRFEWPSDDCVDDQTITVTAWAFVIDIEYTILDPGDTDFTLIGAADNAAGTVFTATGAGVGTGTATYIGTLCEPYTHDVPIDPDYYHIVGFPAHGFVASTNSTPQSMYGYLNQYWFAQIRWRAPQYNYQVYQRAYPPPDFYRIYRSPYFSVEGLTLTNSDYERGVWKLVGEVPHTTDTSYHYFQDQRSDIFNIGIEAYQSIAYSVTAVWENWNWKRGLSYSRHYATPYNWDPYLGGDLNYSMPAPDTEYEDFAIRLDDNTNYRFHRHAGYFKARVTGQYAFHIRSDDSGYLWMGSADQSVSTLEGNRTTGNALTSRPGLHGDQTQTGNINLVADEIYPILSYNGNHGGGHTWWIEFTPPGGARTFDGSDHFYPESGIGAVNPSANDGQFVEGEFSSVVWSYYTN